MDGADGRIARIITDVITELNVDLERPVDVALGADAPLYGDDGVLDSLGLVTLLVSVEQAVEDELGASISLTDEKALSEARGPFRSVGSLTTFVALQLVVPR